MLPQPLLPSIRPPLPAFPDGGKDASKGESLAGPLPSRLPPVLLLALLLPVCRLPPSPSRTHVRVFVCACV
eukprot:4912040-Pleurochrysis_carterae.AAC.6